ncbi:DsrE/DsrF/DrsH-like family protein [Plebeiibacterium sediminum]|uniref:DsrE/DsrF/DrsH-like family protein n=1 Tax=Plebeiibacterium sediminum TaxID=2992112 RepID=A0AAE3M367_9BACT|nr:DsrE/DsrF/DrsH-like family protein [Plebeiobacterium sediminum]MCW3786141.1 DsrE/DsrF/DrsH-like family protein [Plebeiobacterium sediminum]
MMVKEEQPLKKVCIICAKGAIEDVYATLVLANGAVMEGIEAKLFFTFFGLDAITKKYMNKLHTATVGNPAMRMPGGLAFPTWLGAIPGVEGGVSSMMRKQMDELDIPPVDEFLEMITAGGGEIYACKLAMDMFKLTKEDLYEDVSAVLTVGEFYAMCGGEHTQIIFT